MMERQLSRLAVAHAGLIVYIVFSAAIFLKIRYSTIDPFHLYDTALVGYVKLLKAYGFLLFIIPAAWSLWSFRQLRKPASDTESFASLYLSGLIIAVALAFFAASTCLGLMTGTLVKMEEKPRPDTSGSRLNRTELLQP